MIRAANRRDFLGILLSGAPALAFNVAGPVPLRSSSLFGQGSTFRPSITSIPLSDNLIHFTGAGGNVVAALGTDGAVMVNGGRADMSADLLRAVAERSGGKRVLALFNTDWHRAHTGSNETIGKAGATIIAHENTRQYLGAEIYVDWENRTYQPVPRHALPNRTFYTSGTLNDMVPGHRIEYGHLGQAHTDAAIYVFFPETNVLIAGGALSVGKYPIPDYTTGGWLGGLLAANKTLLGLANAETRIVPGAGPIQTRGDLQAQHDMLAAMMDRFPKMMKQGLGPDDIIAASPTREYDQAWGNPDLFVTTAYRSMWLHVRELGGIV